MQGTGGIWLGQENLVLSPTAAFDGKIDINNDFLWKAGGGLTLQFSGMRWVTDGDDWGDLARMGNAYDYRYENNKILKYAYAQVYGAYSEKNDFNLLFRIEEPDGNVGFHDKLGFMAEGRIYNLTEKTEAMGWEAQARVSWDLNIKQYLLIPYLRGYTNQDQVIKVRVGAYANIIPFTAFELAYTSANLNSGAGISAKPLSHYDGIFDAGRIELIVMLKSDNIRPQVPKRMSDWNYPDVSGSY